MKRIRKRKPRCDPENNLNFDGAHMFGQPAYDTPAWRKLRKRWEAGLCLGCGKSECKCKSKS